MDLIFPINKPKGPTSHDIVNKIRKITNIKKIGHAGTLDPLASGVLIIAITRSSTKKIDLIQKKEKEYLATIILGKTSTTYDEEGEKDEINVNKTPDISNIKNSIRKFIGYINQTPPIYSAIKINGKPAYKYARNNKKIEIKSKNIFIKNIEIIFYAWPTLQLKVICGPGTYIRSLANDIGKDLKTGAYLSDLVRTKVGEYDIKQSYTLDQFERFWNENKNNLMPNE